MESARSRVSLLGAIALVLSVASPSQAENCDAIPCKCGDTITVDRTLTSADPVTGLPVCSGTGLFVDGSDLTLNMGSQQLRGENKATVNQTGIVVLPGHTNVTVIDGRLTASAAASPPPWPRHGAAAEPAPSSIRSPCPPRCRGRGTARAGSSPWAGSRGRRASTS